MLFGRGVRFDLTREFLEQGFALIGIAVRLLDHRNQRAMAVVVLDQASENVRVAPERGRRCATDMDGKLLQFVPHVNQAALAEDSVGAIDWACVSETNTTASTRGLVDAPVVANGVKAKWAPSECR